MKKKSGAMAFFAFILGGGRSGKSRQAEALAERSGRQVVYVPSYVGDPGDAEMQERIAIHRRRRPKDWRTLEGRMDWERVLREEDGNAVLMDSLSLWLACQTERRSAPAEVLDRVDEVLAAFDATENLYWIIVGDEVGMGLVPSNASGRQFRDLCGEANQKFAAAADRVDYIVAGLAMPLKEGNR